MIKLSYLVSTYDSGHYLDRHLADLIDNQTDPRFEIVVVNPDSPGTDDMIAKKWATMDSRVRYIYHDERETYGASWLRAWKAAKGRFVINSNTDDFHEQCTTGSAYKHMLLATTHGSKKIGFGYGGMTVVKEDGHVVGRGLKPEFDFDTMTAECWAGPQVIWDNSWQFRQSVDWDLMHERAAQYSSAFDYWLWLYFMSLGFHGHVIPQLLTIYTQRSDSIENSNKWANNWETYVAISEFFPYNFDAKLKHAKEFRDFDNLPPKDEWVDRMQRGKKWRTKSGKG